METPQPGVEPGLPARQASVIAVRPLRHENSLVEFVFKTFYPKKSQ